MDIQLELKNLFFSLRKFNRKIDFVIAGAQKSGTTALDFYLRQHPEICMGKIKEIHFFNREMYFANEKRYYAIYHRHFTPNNSQKILGEATTNYMYWRPAPQRMHQYNPEMKIIIVLRNPITRSFSHWNMYKGQGKEPLDFMSALLAEKERTDAVWPLQEKRYSYLARGRYVEQLERIWEYFPKEQTLILKHDELKKNYKATLAQVFNFLNVNNFEVEKEEDIHSLPYQTKMSNEEKDFLLQYYREEILELEKRLGWDCSDWLL